MPEGKVPTTKTNTQRACDANSHVSNLVAHTSSSQGYLTANHLKPAENAVDVETPFENAKFASETASVPEALDMEQVDLSKFPQETSEFLKVTLYMSFGEILRLVVPL